MSNIIIDTIRDYWTNGRRTKQTSSGWSVGNAPCCSHRGHSPDTRQRGGLMFTEGQGFVWHCFNCGFKAGWQPGKLLSQNSRKLLSWLGISERDVQKLSLETLKNKDDQLTIKNISLTLHDRELPKNTRLIRDILNQKEDFDKVKRALDYLKSRGMKLEWYDWMYSDQPEYQDRIIIPFYHTGRIVGWTARKIGDGKPKYLADSQPSYVFNIDQQDYEKKFVILVEGQFDAIAIDGIAVGHNDPGEAQCARINSLNKTVILLPDLDKSGMLMVDKALAHNWMVSFPNWGPEIKDAADAVRSYGRVYTLKTILDSATSNKIKIEIIKKKYLAK